MRAMVAAAVKKIYSVQKVTGSKIRFTIQSMGGENGKLQYPT
jgi:hypothetical protein